MSREAQLAGAIAMRRRKPRAGTGLPAQAELRHDLRVALGFPLPKVVQQAAAFADQRDQAAPRCVVLGMSLEMIHQVGNPVTEQSNLHFRRTGVLIVNPVARDYGGLPFLRQTHAGSRPLLFPLPFFSSLFNPLQGNTAARNR